MSQWEKRREVWTSGIYYDRYQHDVAGAAVAYDGAPHSRTFLVVVNGTSLTVPYPDGLADYGDHGNPLAVRLRWDKDYGWTFYCYMFMGDDNPKVEWQASLAGWPLAAGIWVAVVDGG